MSEEHAVFITRCVAGTGHDAKASIVETTPELEHYGVYVLGRWADRVGCLVVLRKTDKSVYHGSGYTYWEDVTHE